MLCATLAAGFELGSHLNFVQKRSLTANEPPGNPVPFFWPFGTTKRYRRGPLQSKPRDQGCNKVMSTLCGLARRVATRLEPIRKFVGCECPKEHHVSPAWSGLLPGAAWRT